MDSWGLVTLATVAGAIRGGTPFLFVSLGECLTEKSGKINLGQEGALLVGAMSGYAVSCHSGSPWVGVLAALALGSLMGLLYAWLAQLPRVNDIAVGIALMLFGSGVAFFFGKPYIQPSAPQLPGLPLGGWSDSQQIRAAFNISPLFFIGVGLAFAMYWFLSSTRWGMQIRAAGDQPSAARALGISLKSVRTLSCMAGSGLSAVGGSYLTLFYPGAWTEAISSGQGLMAVALVIFARWDPRLCLLASLLFGGAQSIGPALQAAGIKSGYYLWNASPFILTLIVMVATCSTKKSLAGAPGSLATGE
jgi:simple sugar transport system permease protein